jgi:hypothetical protein
LAISLATPSTLFTGSIDCRVRGVGPCTRHANRCALGSCGAFLLLQVPPSPLLPSPILPSFLLPSPLLPSLHSSPFLVSSPPPLHRCLHCNPHPVLPPTILHLSQHPVHLLRHTCDATSATPPQRSTVLILRGKKAAYHPSMYVDLHGEPDPGLRRGRPLSLARHRLQVGDLALADTCSVSRAHTCTTT